MLDIKDFELSEGEYYKLNKYAAPHEETPVATDKNYDAVLETAQVVCSDIDFSSYPEVFKDLVTAAFKTTEKNDCLVRAYNLHHRTLVLFDGAVSGLRELVDLCFKLAISKGNASAIHTQGARYYSGDLVEQNYTKAAELYELAASMGFVQSIINLGYIYEYGRLGKPDYQEAHRLYALAAALSQSGEALCKLGDMYARGKAVAKDMHTAKRLYRRALDASDSLRDSAQPALRLAKMIINATQPVFSKDDLFEALILFQQAEVGFRMAIADGERYFEKSLHECIEGQARSREMLTENENMILCL